MLVLECIPYQLAKEVSEAVSIPVIGIGAGAGTDGQVLVFHDMIKYGNHHVPKFVEQYADVGTAIHDRAIDVCGVCQRWFIPSRTASLYDERRRINMRFTEVC